MNQILFEIKEIPLVIKPKVIQQNNIQSITGYCHLKQDDKDYKNTFLEYNEHGFLKDYEKYNSQGKIICKRDFDMAGKLLCEKHYIGNEKLELQYEIEYQQENVVKTMKDTMGNVLGKTIISKTSDNQHYKVSNYNRDGEFVSEFEYIYRNGNELPDIISNTRGEYYFKEEKSRIVLAEKIPSAPKNTLPTIYYRDVKSTQITKVEKENNYTIRYQISTY